MEVKLAKTAGFCMGVKLAMDKVLAIAERGRGPVYTHGPLIHNRQAVEMLESQGIRDIEECPEAECGTVLIRAHGVPEEVEASLRARGFEVVDATCPHVLASQRAIERYSARGYRILIAGDKDHAEVAGLVSRAKGGAAVVSTPEEACAVDVPEPVCLLAQTTFNEATYAEIAGVLRERFPRIEVIESICKATHRRQQEVLELAQEVEAMVVVGGLHSANTRRLAEIADSAGIPTFHVETARDLDTAGLARFQVVGLTAGASTPNWITRSVLQALKDIERPVPLAEWLPWRAITALTRSNFYSALAAVALTYASCQLLGIVHLRPALLLVPFCYVFAVTTLNRVAIGEREEPYLPPRIAFYRRYARPFLAISLLFCAGSLMALQILGAWRAMALLISAYVLGVAYSVRLVPRSWRDRIRYTRLKDLPASKDLFVALAWMAACVLAPWLSHGSRLVPGLLVACVFAFVLTFVKAIVTDLGDIQEDHLRGRETLPIVLGERKTRRLMAALALGLGALLALGAALGWTPGVGWLLLACPVYILAYLWLFPRRVLASDVLCTLVSDGALLLAGALALGWSLG
jgi:4-hydroxy-3-methylbut-2-enyl diphosphate reductase